MSPDTPREERAETMTDTECWCLHGVDHEGPAADCPTHGDPDFFGSEPDSDVLTADEWAQRAKRGGWDHES